MDNKTNLFSEFQGTSKNQWLERIEKDLKGRPMSELYERLPNPVQGSESLIIDSFAHVEDFKGMFPTPIVGENGENTWLVGEDIEVKNKDFKAANKQALHALMGGINAPHFIFETFPAAAQLAVLLMDIELDYISIFFSEKTKNKNPLDFLQNFEQLALKQGENAKMSLRTTVWQLRGGIIFDPFADGRHEVKATSELLLWAKEKLPLFKVLSIDAGVFFKGSENVIAELGQTLKAGENYLKRLTDVGIEASLVAERIQFSFHIGIHYFIEMAKIRAFKLLWANVLTAYYPPLTLSSSSRQGGTVFCTIQAIISSDTQVEDGNANKIRATTQAMSAILGGVSSLTIAPSDVKNVVNVDFNHRIARNIQHLLQMESYFDRVADPAAGSYYIEQLTNQIAEAAWQYFQELSSRNTD
jgi:methylmalonyl-CoA mutase